MDYVNYASFFFFYYALDSLAKSGITFCDSFDVILFRLRPQRARVVGGCRLNAKSSLLLNEFRSVG